MMLCSISFTLPFLQKDVTRVRSSIEMRFLSVINMAFQVLSKEWQNLLSSNKTNLALISEINFLLEVFGRLGLHLCGASLSSMTFVLVEEVWLMCNVIQIVMRLFWIWISPPVSLFIFCQCVFHFKPFLHRSTLPWAQVYFPSATPGHL